MPRDEVTEKIGFGRSFTVAGVKSKYEDVSLEFYAEKLDQLIFFFHPSGFERVIEAVKDKFPLVKCDNSTVSNAMGASFPQTHCELSDSDSLLTLVRVVDIKTSALTLVSKRKNSEKEKINSENKKDI